MERWSFGEAPLDEAVRLAGALRDVIGMVLALEHPTPELHRLVGDVERARDALAAHQPPDLAPRLGPDAHDGQRVYLDHARDVGAFNPCVPEYELVCADERGTGTVTFPLAYEGPPGIVHGGFLGLFFDCVFQQLNCDLGLSGRTSSMSVRYRRPTPVLTALDVAVWRTVDDRRIEGHATLEHGGEVLCEAEVRAAVGDRSRLPAVSPRRPA